MTFPTPLAARQAIADELRFPLAKLGDEDRAFINGLLAERYCGSNKIWATKVKRLRLPDLLCVKTGLRVEVRAKSDLKIRMSDAPNNPDRAPPLSIAR